MNTDHPPPAACCQPPGEPPPARSTDTPARGCCGGPPRADASACCALDETNKAGGKAGCGCARRSSAADPAHTGATAVACQVASRGARVIGIDHAESGSPGSSHRPANP